MNIIEAKNLTFSYNNIPVIDSLNLQIKEKNWTCIIGKNSCGKTTLLKLLGGYIVTKNNIILNNIYINQLNLDVIKNSVGYLFPENNFFCKTVFEELSIMLSCDDSLKKSIIRKIMKKYDMYSFINQSPQRLSYFLQTKLSLIKIFLKHPKVIFLDDSFSNLTEVEKNEIHNILKDYTHDNNVSIVATLNDLSDSFYYDRIIVLHNKNIILDGSPELVFKQELILKKIGLKLPFIYELSEKLKLYDLIDDEFFIMEDLVNELC